MRIRAVLGDARPVEVFREWLLATRVDEEAEPLASREGYSEAATALARADPAFLAHVLTQDTFWEAVNRDDRGLYIAIAAARHGPFVWPPQMATWVGKALQAGSRQLVGEIVQTGLEDAAWTARAWSIPDDFWSAVRARASGHHADPPRRLTESSFEQTLWHVVGRDRDACDRLSRESLDETAPPAWSARGVRRLFGETLGEEHADRWIRIAARGIPPPRATNLLRRPPPGAVRTALERVLTEATGTRSSQDGEEALLAVGEALGSAVEPVAALAIQRRCWEAADSGRWPLDLGAELIAALHAT